MAAELSPEQLRSRSDLSALGIKNTKHLKAHTGIIGQERAVSSLKFGLEIRHLGYNIYVAGQPGIGKMTAVQSYLEDQAREKDTPTDWCYVNNFSDSYQPKVHKLPAGRACQLQQDMKHLIEYFRKEIPKAFESEEYNRRREEITKSITEQEEQVLEKLKVEAREEGFALQPTPMGIMIIPLKDDHPISEQEFQALPADKREALQKQQKELQKKLKNSMKQVRKLERNSQEKLKEIDQKIVLYLVGGLIDDLIEKYQDLPEIVAYLEEVQKDIMENIDTFKDSQSGSPEDQAPAELSWQKEQTFRKYQVNVLVDNSQKKGVPVVLELNPAYHNLFGRIEKEARFGALYTDFTLIKAGSIHRANGGFLVLSAEDVLRNMFSWDSLKRALRNNAIQIEEMSERMGFISAKSLRPQAVPLDLKIVLVGRPYIYYLLHELDEEFPELFKVKADFDTQMVRDEKNVQHFLGFISHFCTKEDLRHLEIEAVEKLLEHSSRIVADQQKLSTNFGKIADIVREANFWAIQEKAPYIRSQHIQKALEEKIYRSNLIEEHLREMITRGTILIECVGEAVGQVNGLSVLAMGEYQFGQPGRITATVGPGREGIVDIEREVELGGPIHSKGVMILSGYLMNKFAARIPLTLSARLVFEQSYSGVEGDSASSAELYAIISALAGAPIKQSIAVTGSVNQRGEVQAIGGVNEKIEGYFQVCKAKGLTGDQGVLIPQSNVQNLMLREEIVEAVEAKKFHIWAVKTIDEGIELLTGKPAGAPDSRGKFPRGTLNHLVHQRLVALNETLKKEDKEKGA